jgi:uncharacterized protein
MRTYLALLSSLFLSTALQAQIKVDRTLDGAYPHLYEPAFAKPKYDKVKSTNFYIPMRDGVRIAVTLHLPEGLPAGEKIPLVMVQTRYWRNFELRGFYKGLLNAYWVGPQKIKKQLIGHGYAVMDVDVRGTGASFGKVPCPWSQEEIFDGADIATWVTKQPWSNGNIGTAGVSYSGTTAEMALVPKHPAFKAAVAMFSLYDVYDDISFPGGVHLEGFTKNWSAANLLMDQNIPPSKKLAKFVKGVLPVDDDKDRSQLNAAVNEGVNYDVHSLAQNVRFRDDTAKGFIAATVDTFSPHRFRKQVNEGGAAVLCWSGWYDGAYPHSAIKRFLTLTNPKNKLMLGPWNHGGSMRISPDHAGKANFPHISELLKFFDYHLKGLQNGLYDEPRVHYYTMGEEKWKTANTWPPASKPTPIYLAPELKLSNELPPSVNEFRYQVDTNARTGLQTRWASLRSALTDPKAYGDRAAAGDKLLSFYGPVLTEDLTISGHPIADIYLAADTTDATLFVYLEDVAPDGTVRYVTEGQLRALHRWYGVRPSGRDETVYTPPFDAPDVPYRDYKREHGQLLTPGVPARFKFDLLPTSYTFVKGHRLRIGIAGADIDNFERLKGKLPVFTVQTGGNYPSQIVLPVEVR